jgi:hypothetical protein
MKSRTVFSSETEIVFSVVRHQNALEDPPSRFSARATLSGESASNTSAKRASVTGSQYPIAARRSVVVKTKVRRAERRYHRGDKKDGR